MSLPNFPQRKFLLSLFSKLNTASIRYVVLRNADSLPETTDGGDLDILVDPDDAENTLEILSYALRETNGIPIGSVSSKGYFKMFVIGKPMHFGEWWGVYIDITFGLRYKVACDLADTRYSNEIAITKKGVRSLNSNISGVIGVLKEVLYNNQIPIRYLQDARCCLDTNFELVSRFLRPAGYNAINLLKVIIQEADASYIGKLRRSLYFHNLLINPILFLWRRCANELFKVSRFLYPPGVFIAILGVDGTGKSTVIEAIRPVLEEATHNALFVHHLRPNLMPPLARLKGKKAVQTGPVLEPHGAIPSGVIGSLVRLIYYTFDYILGYWLKIRSKIAKEPAIVLFDRYAYDMALDPRRFRIRSLGCVAGWFAALAPKPDLILCLYASPEIIATRKQELPLEETRRQVGALQEFARKERRAVLISTEGSIDEVRERVLQAMYDYFAQKWGKHVRLAPRAKR